MLGRMPRAMKPVQDIGHVFLEVGDMEEALRFYRDTLGFTVKGKSDPVWTIVETAGGSLTLFRKKDPVPCARRDGGSPFNFHVANFEDAAKEIERAGFPVLRGDANTGSVRDPWGNVLSLHDHRND